MLTPEGITRVSSMALRQATGQGPRLAEGETRFKALVCSSMGSKGVVMAERTSVHTLSLYIPQRHAEKNVVQRLDRLGEQQDLSLIHI